MIVCKKCNNPQDNSDFYRNNRVCKECKSIESKVNYLKNKAIIAERHRLYRRDNKVKIKKYQEQRYLKIKDDLRYQQYNLTREDFEKLLSSQGNRCACCGEASPGLRDWNVDHDHNCCPGKESCGKCIRGLLCSHCNPMLGFAKDNISRLQSAINYLRVWQGLDKNPEVC